MPKVLERESNRFDCGDMPYPLGYYNHVPNYLHSFYKHVFSVYYVPGTVLGAGDTAKNKTDKNHSPNGVDSLMGGKQKISK